MSLLDHMKLMPIFLMIVAMFGAVLAGARPESPRSRIVRSICLGAGIVSLLLVGMTSAQ